MDKKQILSQNTTPFLLAAKQRVGKFTFSFEKLLVVALVIITSTVSYTGVVAYQSLIKLADVMAESNETEKKMLLIKSIPNELISAESNIKSYALSRQKDYLKNYYRSIAKVKRQQLKLDSMINDSSVMQAKFDSATVYVNKKTKQLKAFADMQQRWSVVNELDILSFQIEQNKKLLAHYLKGKKVLPKATKKEYGFLDRIFRAKEIKREMEEQFSRDSLLANDEKAQARGQLQSQIEAMESVAGSVGSVKQRQAETLKRLDKKELKLTQKNKAITEKLNAYFISIEMDEVIAGKKILEDIDSRHKKSDTLIALFSVFSTIFLLVIGYIVISFIRKKNAYQKALLAAKNEAEEYSLLQERFLANMSHEIRTPMNAISGFTDQLLQTQLQPQQETHLNIIKQSVKYLLVIINDILDYAKLKADKLTVEQIPFSIMQTINETIELLDASAKAKGVKLKLDEKLTVPKQLLGDSVRLKQILLNIIGNAIKFTENGAVTITVDCIEQTEKESHVKIKVVDTGIGISQENLSKIFNAFEQAEMSTTRKYGGSGLGLSITQRLVHLLNGVLLVNSEEGKGTEMSIILVFDNVNEESKDGLKFISSISPKDFSEFIANKNILVADDDDWNLELLVTVFKKFNANIVAVKNGSEAVAEFLKQPFDVVLMDVRMPELNGFEATRKIRKSKTANANIPIIGLTANASPSQVDKCLNAGMNAVFGKPFDEVKLYNIIYNNIQKNQIGAANNMLPDMKQAISENTMQSQRFSLNGLKEMGEIDDEYIIKMLSIFISGGSTAFAEMAKALKHNDFVEIEHWSHKIIPSTRHLEANNLTILLKQIEQRAIDKNKENLELLYGNAKEEFDLLCQSMQQMIAELSA